MADSLQIFTVTKDPELVRKFEFADNVHRFLKATELVFIVPKDLTRDFLIAYGSRDFCKIVEEGEILKQSLSDIEKWDVWGFPAGAGWYFQQFLKLAIVPPRACFRAQKMSYPQKNGQPITIIFIYINNNINRRGGGFLERWTALPKKQVYGPACF